MATNTEDSAFYWCHTHILTLANFTVIQVNKPPLFHYYWKTVDKLSFRQITLVCFQILNCPLLNTHSHPTNRPPLLFSNRHRFPHPPTERAACDWARVHSLWGAEGGGGSQVNLVALQQISTCSVCLPFTATPFFLKHPTTFNYYSPIINS